MSRESLKGKDEIKKLVIQELAALYKIDESVIADAYLTYHLYNWYQDEMVSGACTSFISSPTVLDSWLQDSKG